MGSRWVHGERHLPRYRERSRHRSAQLPRRLCRTISKSCSWPLRVLSLGSCATVKKHPVRLAVPPRHEEFQARGDEEPTRALADNVRKGSITSILSRPRHIRSADRLGSVGWLMMASPGRDSGFQAEPRTLRFELGDCE